MASGLREWVPRWWRGEAGWVGRGASIAVWPAEQLFRGIVAARNRAYDAGLLRSERAPIPVISVGNLGVGGAGKTPFAAWVAGRLQEWGRRPAVVLRGYGADEILVHRELNPGVPVHAARARIEGVREAAAAGSDVVVLDDAFQHRAVQRDLDIVLLSADAWSGRVRLLPRGPWREDLGALRRADLVVVTRKAADDQAVGEVLRSVDRWVDADQMIGCRLSMGALSGLGGATGAHVSPGWLAGRAVLVVTSLADPGPFVAQLRACGAQVELAAYPDHHEFSPADAVEIAARAGNRPLVMTLKEAVKLRQLLPPQVQGWTVNQELTVEKGSDVLDAALRRVLSE